MAFNFNFNSPSTPKRKGQASLFSQQAPSTTPAGPPPTHLTNLSTTPAGNPPASSRFFGSSFNATTNTFGHRDTPGRRGKPSFAVPESSPPPFEEVGEEVDDDEEEDAEGELMSPDQTGFLESFLEPSPRGQKRERNGQVREQVDSGMVDIARATARDNGPAQRIEEADVVVLRTDETVAALDVAANQQPPGVSRELTITNAVADLTRLWRQHSKTETLPGGIGPESDDAVTKSAYLSTLLLQLHHPHTSKLTRPTQTLALTQQQPPHSSSISLPHALLEWLNTHHNPIPDDFADINLNRPSPAAHSGFWDLVGADLLRGRFTRVIRLLKDAGWQHAATARADIHQSATGYQGRQLENVEEVISRCIRVLETCPAIASPASNDGDWDVAGPDWALFRQRVRRAIRDLEAFATSGNDPQPRPHSGNIFADSTSMTASTARAESRVPQNIYEQLRMLYGILLGGNGILDFAQDWVEASILLTVWWDGEENNNATALDASLAGLAVSKRKSVRGGATRVVDVSPPSAYQKRLADMFRLVTSHEDLVDDPNFQLDTLDPVQVGLACIFEDKLDAVVGLIRTWSQTMATTVVEIAALGAWSASNHPNLLGRGFSSEDLMVLSHGPKPQDKGTGDINRDALLISYADLLARKDKFGNAKEGWEIAISVLGRLDDNDAAHERIRAVLETLKVAEEARVERVLEVCTGMGFEGLGRGIAENYADTLANSDTPIYGPALIYYARAHSATKLKSTLSLLITLSLIHSAALPTPANTDSTLAALLSSQRTPLITLARSDPEAAEMLGRGVSGYAMLRRFYDLRDSASSRKSDVVATLLAVIGSAADCLRGGLFDPEIESVVPVEGLLVLLGEALPLLGQGGGSAWNLQQLVGLMGVVEDLEQVSGRIREGAEGLLRESMIVYRGKEESSWSLMQRSRGDVQRRGWDWRKGFDMLGVQAGRVEVVRLVRMALAGEVAGVWGQAR